MIAIDLTREADVVIHLAAEVGGIGAQRAHPGRFSCADPALFRAWDASRPDGQPRRCLDTPRARERLPWRARTDFDTGLRQTLHGWRSRPQAGATPNP